MNYIERINKCARIQKSFRLQVDIDTRLCEISEKIGVSQNELVNIALEGLIESFDNNSLHICEMCSNALVVEDLTHDNDFSSISVGDVDNGYRMSINAGNRRPVCIDVEKWDEQTKQNIVIARYYPKFCPNCGRLLFEYRVKTE